MTTYLYRDRLTRHELLPAVAAGVGAGLAVGLTVAYLTQLMLRKRQLPSAPPSSARVEPAERGRA